ncbi:MAG: sugar ABC transporter permease [Clostridiales bacterium]|nr:sugar ABC transporter permease [Clostridiales bacterium]
MKRNKSRLRLPLTVVATALPLLLLAATLFAYLGIDISARGVDLGAISCRAVSASQTDDSWFAGTADGVVRKYNAANELLWEKRVVEKASVTDDAGDTTETQAGVKTVLGIERGVFVFGEDQYIYEVDGATGETLQKSAQKFALQDGYVEWSDEGLYVAGNAGGMSNQLFVVRFDYDLSKPRAAVQYSGGVLEIKGFAIPDRGGETVFLDKNGILLAYPKALTAQNFRAGAELYKAELEQSAIAMSVDKTTGEFFLIAKDNAAYGFKTVYDAENGNSMELSFGGVPLKEDLEGCFLDRFNHVLYATAKTMSAVYMVDTERGAYIGEFSAFFDIVEISVSEHSDNLFMSVYEPGASPPRVNLYFYDRNALPKINLVKTLRVTGAILTAAFAAVGAATLAALWAARFGQRARGVFRRINKSKRVYLFLFPSMALLAVFCYYPGFSSLLYAFMDYRIGYPLRFIGLDNFKALFANAEFVNSIKNMAIFLAADIVKAVVPPLIFAELILAMRSARARYAARILLYLPGVLPVVAVTLVWTYGIYGVDGLLNQTLRAFGADPVYFLSAPGTNIVSLVFMNFPFIGSYLILYGALNNIPDEYYQAAKMEGCSWLRRIVTIDIPLIGGQIQYLFIIGFIASVQDVGRIMLTTSGAGNSSVPIYIMYNYISANELGRSSAIALMLFAFLAAVTALNMRKTVKRDEV